MITDLVYGIGIGGLEDLVFGGLGNLGNGSLTIKIFGHYWIWALRDLGITGFGHYRIWALRDLGITRFGHYRNWALLDLLPMDTTLAAKSLNILDRVTNVVARGTVMVITLTVKGLPWHSRAQSWHP